MIALWIFLGLLWLNIGFWWAWKYWLKCFHEIGVDGLVACCLSSILGPIFGIVIFMEWTRKSNIVIYRPKK